MLRLSPIELFVSIYLRITAPFFNRPKILGNILLVGFDILQGLIFSTGQMPTLCVIRMYERNIQTLERLNRCPDELSDMYSNPVFRGTLKPRDGGQRFGRLKLDVETAFRLGSNNVGLFVENCPSFERMVEHFYQLVDMDRGSSKIERHVPIIPLSREVKHLANLKNSLVLYRMVFRQNRQEDLVEYLRDHLTEAQLAEFSNICRIELSPV